MLVSTIQVPIIIMIAVMARKYSKPVQAEDDSSSMLHLVISNTGYNYAAECVCTVYHPPQLFESAVLQYSIQEQVKDCTGSKQLLVGPLVNYEFVCPSPHNHHLDNHASGHTTPHQCTDQQSTCATMFRNTLQHITPKLTRTKAKLLHYQYYSGTEN